MQSVAKFGTSAYRVSGSCDDLLQLLPDTLHVQGRIAHEQVWDYLLQLKSSTSRVGIDIFSIPDGYTFLVILVLRTWNYITVDVPFIISRYKTYSSKSLISRNWKSLF